MLDKTSGYQLCGGFSLYIYRDGLFDRHSGSGVDFGWSVLGTAVGVNCDTQRLSLNTAFREKSPETF